MTSEDIKHIFILAKLKNGDFFQFAIDRTNKNTYLSVINTLENGLKLIEADFSDVLEVKDPIGVYTEDEAIH
jgi:hypothetical protein